MSLILVGVTEGGRVLLHKFEAPDFTSHIPHEDYVVVGSGARVADYLAVHMREVDSSTESDLKVRVDRLLPGLEDALRQINEATVGGMLQIVLADAGGIRPYTYRHVDLDPDRPPDAKRMDMKAGRWTQTDLATGDAIDLVRPHRLILAGPAPMRFHDFAPVASEKQSPKWHPLYLLTCARAEVGPGVARFEGVLSAVVLRRYPTTFHCLVALGLWGTNGEHSFKVVLEASSDRAAVVVAEGAITLEHFPEAQDFIFEVAMDVPRAGQMFLACYIGGQRVARRALFFGDIALKDRSPDEVSTELERQQLGCSDAELEAGSGAEVVYFTLCQICRIEGLTLSFEGEFAVLYSRDYPTSIRACAALGLRLRVGEHTIRLEVVNAESGAARTVTDTRVVSSSSFGVSRLHGDVPLHFSEPGPYFVNVRVDGQRVTSALLHADNPDSPSSYKLRAVDVPKAGETFVLLKRSIQAPASNVGN